MAGINMADLPKNLTRHYFTCNIIFTKKFYLPYFKIIPNFLSRLRICLQFQSKITFKIKRLFPEKSAYYK